MKIAVMNFSGNVGKSTIAQHLLLPRMADAELITVESINSDDSGQEPMRGEDFKEVQNALLLLDSAIVDVGQSNVEPFVTLMKQYQGAHEDYDFFVVPTISESKQQRDTISTIEALSDMGVPAKKIRLVFNMVPPDRLPERLFPGLFEYHKEGKKFVLNTATVIHRNGIYDDLRGVDMTMKRILEESTDFKTKIKEAKDVSEKLAYSKLLGIQRLAQGVTLELDAVFKALFR